MLSVRRLRLKNRKSQKMRKGNQAECLIAHKSNPTWSDAVWPDDEFEAFIDHARTKTSVTDTESQSLMGDI